MIDWPQRLTEWREKYNRARLHFVSDIIGRVEALDHLRNLRFRGDALRVEISEWARERDNRINGLRFEAKQEKQRRANEKRRKK